MAFRNSFIHLKLRFVVKSESLHKMVLLCTTVLVYHLRSELT